MTPLRLAVIGFLGHAPGLWLFARHKLDRTTARLNIAAALATVAVIAIGALIDGGLGAFVAWVIGHFIWSFILAGRLLRQSASPSENSTS